jgi:hypothetical protein
MSIKDFQMLIGEIRSEVEEGNVNAVFENIVKVAEVAQTCNKTGLRHLTEMIRYEKK